MAFSAALPADIAEDDEFGFEEKFPVRPQTWTPDDREVEELDGLDDALGQAVEQDLPMLMMDDTDAESVDDLTEINRRPGSYAFDSRPGSSMFARPSSYAQEWNGEDGGLDSHANHERLVILSPHALSATSSVTSTQMKELLERDESSHDSSGHSERYDTPSDDCDNESIQFYPTQTDESKSAEGSLGRMSSYTSSFDPSCLFELKDEKDELAAATATVSATEKVLRRMRDLQDEALYQKTRQFPSPSSSTTSLYSEEDKSSEVDEPLQDLRQALAQVESSLADQARILFTIEQERKKDAAMAAAASSET